MSPIPMYTGENEHSARQSLSRTSEEFSDASPEEVTPRSNVVVVESGSHEALGHMENEGESGHAVLFGN